MAIMCIIIFSYFKRRKKHYAKTILSRQWNVEKAFLNIYHKSALYSSIYFKSINSLFHIIYNNMRGMYLNQSYIWKVL